MPRITLKETITKEIDIPIDALCNLIDNLSDEERETLLAKLKEMPGKLIPFKKDAIDSIISDFKTTDLYEEDFLKDLEDGLRKSSANK